MFALLDKAAQNAFHRGEGFHFLFNVDNFGFDASANINAVLLRLDPQRQQLPNLIEREAQLLSAFDESQPMCSFRGKLTIACFSPGRLR